MRQSIKIKQKKNSFDKLVSSSFLALFVVVFFYIYQNVSIVFNMIEYKKSITKINSLEKSNLAINSSTTEYKKNLALGMELDKNYTKVKQGNFVIRKSSDSNLTLLYDIR